VTRGPYDFHLADEVFGGGDGALGDGDVRIPEAVPSAPAPNETAADETAPDETAA
jgi:cytochrome c oxidase subunit 1